MGAVYDITPVQRSPNDILPRNNDPDEEREPVTDGPAARNKWLTAGITDDAAAVIGQVFNEADRRDPRHQRPWVWLVDGNNHQIECIHTQAQARNAEVTIVIDFIHVLEYLWKATWSFHTEGDPAAETWVTEQARRILDGHATSVADTIRDTATHRELTTSARKNADTAAGYLTRKATAGYLDYPTALQQGWPIATGIIEGACRHLIADRMDITGARWGLTSAEAILKLRALTTNNNLNQYWTYHLQQQHHHNHPT